MDRNLKLIIEWVRKNASPVLDHLNTPANDDLISSVESETGINLPDSFKDFLRCYDGEDGEGWLALFGNGNQLLPCLAIIDQYRLDQEIGESLFEPQMETIEFWKDSTEGNVIFIKGAVKPLTLHPKWVPITCMNGDVLRYLDFDPAPGGINGQVIEVDPECCSYQVLASSFEELLAIYGSQLQENFYTVDDEGYIESSEESEMNWGVPEWLKNA